MTMSGHGNGVPVSAQIVHKRDDERVDEQVRAEVLALLEPFERLLTEVLFGGSGAGGPPRASATESY